MTPTLNKYLGIGNLAKDPELRTTNEGNPVVNMQVVVTSQYTNNKKELITEPCFVDVEVFGRKAQYCSDNLHKGSLVFVEGRLREDSWIGKDDKKKRTKLMVRATNIINLMPKSSKDTTVVLEDTISTLELDTQKEIIDTVKNLQE